MFGIQEQLIREVSGIKERNLGEEMDPVRSWVRNVGVVDANVAAQRYKKEKRNKQTYFIQNVPVLVCLYFEFYKHMFTSQNQIAFFCKYKTKKRNLLQKANKKSLNFS